ncbi:hypothetical protein V6B16_05425 [Salinimicrobium catena]|uniref:hypothetical protein n=1 Tax=Salinimicrobium catena TaxID=390640 RepID=UPI002FE43E21
MKQLVIILSVLFNSSPLMFAQGAQNIKIAEMDSLKLGEEKIFGNISVEFIRVISDSRCPESVACIWEGEAKILLGINFNRNYSEKQVTISGRTSKILELGEIKFSILQLDPYPVTPKKITPKEYSLGSILDTAP